ncbi:hypothetical protein BC777_3828 [Yoonia maricola]|uniref:MFS transporter n=1 Tax=Yoonia maricola TaxID=420999 RepID=A0A2M8W036_9RHOB|nr:hypothetical protein [Yoonia maricola]PJI84287.1 hypothetical protein BC777_3828 [Yoonia maricola]
MSPAFLFGPILAGHAFQQTAFIAMVSVLAQLLGLSESQIGIAIAAGLLMSAFGPPFAGLLGGRVVIVGALCGLLMANLALFGLLGGVASGISSGLILTVLIVIRGVQGLSVSCLLMAAQQASFEAPDSLKTLAKVQSMGSLGRIGASLSVGLLVLLSPLAPLVPGAIGALLSLFRIRNATPPRLRATARPPDIAAFRVTALTQIAVGASQIGLAPAMMARLSLSPEAIAGYAGLCLAAANLGLFLALRLIVPRAAGQVARLAGLGLLLAGAFMTIVAHPAAFIVISFVIGGSTAVLFTLNLSDIMTRKDFAQLQVAGWNGAVQIASLAIGVGLGSAFLTLSSAAPFVIAGLCGAVLAIFPPQIQRT